MKYFFEDNHAIVENGILKSIDLNSLVVIPEGVKTILGEREEFDLGNRKIKGIVFYEALYQNGILKRVVLPESGVKRIGEKAFEHCHLLSDINLPEGLEEIRLSAFLGCNKLKSINLPHSIKLLDQWCFYLIDDLIINYNGTTEEWNKIKKGKDWTNKGTLVNTLDGDFII